MIPTKNLEQIQKLFLKKGHSLSVVESCTGGLLSFWLTSLPDSSKYFKGGLVSYSTAVKIEQLGLDPKKCEEEGLVTKNCAGLMAQSIRKLFKTDWSVSITGVAGPAKGSLGEPVGKVAFSVDSEHLTKNHIQLFGDLKREDIRHKASLFALDFLLLQCISNRDFD